MRVLVTGGAGYIGSHTIKAMLENQGYDEVVVVDNLSTGTENAIQTLKEIRDFKFYKISLEETDILKEIFKRHKFDAVIHFAAFIEVFESMKNPIKYYKNNLVNTINLISLCNDFNVNNFIFSSTAAVYGDVKDTIINEEYPKNPINPYGRSKLFVEQILADNAYANQNFKFVALRYFNVAGAATDGTLGQDYPNATHLIKVVCQTVLNKKEKICIFGDDYPTSDGTCIRDYIHVQDLANAHIGALKYLQDGGNSDIFNVGYGRGFSVKEIINAAKDVSKVDFNVEIANRRAGDPACLIANCQKIKSKIGWQPINDDINLIIKNALEWEKK